MCAFSFGDHVLQKPGPRRIGSGAGTGLENNSFVWADGLRPPRCSEFQRLGWYGSIRRRKTVIFLVAHEVDVHVLLSHADGLFVPFEVISAADPFAPGHAILDLPLLAAYMSNFGVAAHVGIYFNIVLSFQAAIELYAAAAMQLL
ncbi:hypothetical protein GGR53DRAFT_468266 [Hypoxylon sp. FL1150]|nr:hypothetical protein GGR53DRAFT_468266 [Hypoxylon sp. FL1150]